MSRKAEAVVTAFALTLLVSFIATVAVAAGWSWVIMLFVGATKPQWGWGYWHTMFPFGITLAIILVAVQSMFKSTRSS